MLEVFSRYVVGWMVAHRESASPRRVVHRGDLCPAGHRPRPAHHPRRPGTGDDVQAVAYLLADLGVTKTHARPHVSNDNPFSEAQFKTLKYRPAFPGRFGAIQDARAHCHVFFLWYNTEHHHSALGLLTPADVHHGRAEQRVAARAAVLATDYAAHPERFPAGRPHTAARPLQVWINPPKPRATEEALLHLNSTTDCVIPVDRFRVSRSSGWRTAGAY
jgi:putative transposase